MADFLTLHNEYRANHGSSPLEIDDKVYKDLLLFHPEIFFARRARLQGSMKYWTRPFLKELLLYIFINAIASRSLVNFHDVEI